MSTDHDPMQQAFESVIRRFKLDLGNDELYGELLKTKSIDEVYNITDQLQAEQAKNGHLRHLSKIQPFLEGLSSYASVIEVFMQAKPDVIALIWGPIKLLIQWTSVLKAAFDAIINTTAEIGVLLPELRKVSRLFTENKQIKDVMVLFLKDILDFYLIALKFFSSSRWKLIFEPLWPRQKDKIGVVTQHINRLTLLMREEVRMEHIQAEYTARNRALEHFERTEKHHRQEEFRSIRTNISPKTYDDAMYHLQSRTLAGTEKWLLRDATFHIWLENSESSINLLWLMGIPGAGKTYLSCTVARKTRSHGITLFAFLTHALKSTTTALSILHSLIFQLTHERDDLQEILCQSSREDLKWNIEMAVDLLVRLLASAEPVYIIIDGLDEIEELERDKLLNQLLRLGETVKRTSLLISSRPEADITAILKTKAAIVRVDHRNSGSIQAFVTDSMQRWFTQREFLPEAQAKMEGLLAPLASKSKGMFLYAKVILNTIQDLEPHEICHELRVLPESLDDVYGRVLARINSLRPPVLKEKARRLLGWIGCSTTPLTIQELEQALVIDLDDIENERRVFSSLEIVRICGPIVEVVDEYVQFVHFTVKEYLFSPRISGFLDTTEAVINLAMCCIAYLCQHHHDPEIDDEELSGYMLSGLYRLHDFSATMWSELVERATVMLPTGLPDTLLDLLKRLWSQRTNESCKREPNAPILGYLQKFPELNDMLCEAIQFRRAYSNSNFDKAQDTTWVNLDPLTTSAISVRIHGKIDILTCTTTEHKEHCYCDVIQRHQGKRLFKCGFLGCSFRRRGFESRSDRNTHMRHHGRPWKCGFPSCEFAEGGFLSRKMRDDHLDRFHQSKPTAGPVVLEKLDADEIQPLLFDLVSADKVDLVRGLLPDLRNLPRQVKRQIFDLAASSGSSDMLDLIYEERPTEFGYSRVNSPAVDMTRCSCKTFNMDTFKYLISKLPLLGGEYFHPLASALPEVLRSDSEEMLAEWIKGLNFQEKKFTSKVPRASFFIATDIIRATESQPDREEFVLRVWRRLDLVASCGEKYIGDALVNVASTTCSIKLASFLLECGACVDHRRSPKYMTPLHHAARKTSLEAAQFMKFLLHKGADPRIITDKKNTSKDHEVLRIQDEKGAKGISKWLGISWDELLASVQEEREKEQARDSKETYFSE